MTGSFLFGHWSSAMIFYQNTGVYSGGIFYNNGPLQAGIAYEANNKVRGPNLNDWALSIAGAWNFGAFRIGGQTEATITVDRGRLARYGINVSDVDLVVQTALAGAAVNAFYEGDLERAPQGAWAWR